ncbi:MAG TPA: carboxypeptidase regulatory-like domain-containing protein [Thermoanaerobaculia bacterium]|nr:carboxypeptidase regulatory-like domain-containing protein [Thermoanaerobaculia bacterium]
MRAAIVSLFFCATLAAADKPSLPVLSGAVFARASGAAVGGAAIHAGETIVALTDPTGRYSFEADPARWPESITVHAAPFTPVTIPVPRARTSAALRDIHLSLGGSIAVALEQPRPGEVVEVELLKLQEGRTRATNVTRKSVTHEPMIFEDLAPGAYVVLAKGDEPWERRGEIVEVTQGTAEKVAMTIAPFRLTLRTRLDGQPLARTEVELTHRDGRWDGKLTTDDAGEAMATLWQGGRVTAAVHSTAVTAPWLERRTIATDDTELRLDVPLHEITGVVVDARKGTPIPGAALRLKVVTDAGFTLNVGATADEQGHFRIAPAAYGEHTLRAAAAHHPPMEMTYSFRAPEERRSLSVRLDAAVPVRVHVTGPRGAPIDGARAMHFRGLGRLGISRTDPGGLVEIPVPEDVPSELWVVPRDGSFGFLPLSADAGELSLRIAEGTSRIVLRAESEARVPIPNVSVVVRYNGRVLPADVIEALRTMQGARPATDEHGRIVFDHMPAGVYEFWPVGSPAELRELAFGVGPEAPVKIIAGVGESVAVMTFAAAGAPSQ